MAQFLQSQKENKGPNPKKAKIIAPVYKNQSIQRSQPIQNNQGRN